MTVSSNLLLPFSDAVACYMKHYQSLLSSTDLIELVAFHMSKKINLHLSKIMKKNARAEWKELLLSLVDTQSLKKFKRTKNRIGGNEWWINFV